ncbi:MAG: hypothetical protein ABMA14_07805 [Hyphomonadaceae bacterium]
MQKAAIIALLGSLLAAMPATAQSAAGQSAGTQGAVSANPELSVDTGIRTLLADPKAKDVIAKYAPTVVEFFTSGQAEGLVSAETPLTTLAQNPMAIDAGLNPENMKKISDELAGR